MINKVIPFQCTEKLKMMQATAGKTITDYKALPEFHHQGILEFRKQKMESSDPLTPYTITLNCMVWNEDLNDEAP